MSAPGFTLSTALSFPARCAALTQRKSRCVRQASALLLGPAMKKERPVCSLHLRTRARKGWWT